MTLAAPPPGAPPPTYLAAAINHAREKLDGAPFAIVAAVEALIGEALIGEAVAVARDRDRLRTATPAPAAGVEGAIDLEALLLLAKRWTRYGVEDRADDLAAAAPALVERLRAAESAIAGPLAYDAMLKDRRIAELEAALTEACDLAEGGCDTIQSDGLDPDGHCAVARESITRLRTIRGGGA